MSDENKWHSADDVPSVEPRSMCEYIIAVYRGDSGKIYSFAAYYLNAYPLHHDDDNPELNDDEGLRSTTGWFDNSSNFDYDDFYIELNFVNGDKLMGWCDIPKWPTP